MKPFTLSFAALLFTLFIFSGCGLGKAKKEAEATMQVFHKHLGNQNYEAIMNLVHTDGLAITPREQWLEIFQSVGELGKPEVKQNFGFNTEASNGNVTVELSYTLKYSDQKLSEKVILRKEKGVFKIYGYHIK